MELRILKHWEVQGLGIQRLGDGPALYPFVAREDAGHGRHWLYVRSTRPIDAGAELVLKFTLRPVGLPALRLRVDIAGEVMSANLDFVTARATAGEFERVTMTRTPEGVYHVEAACRSVLGGVRVVCGLMFHHGDRVFDYAGGHARLIVDAAAMGIEEVDPPLTEPEPDPEWELDKAARDLGVHSRHSEFGKKAHELCKGKGLAINTLDRPFDLDAQVIHLAERKTADLRKAYRESLRLGEVSPVQLVWKEMTYPFLDDHAFDFVISKHVLEHAANPGRVIEEWLRVVRRGGIVYTVVADKDHTADKKHPATAVEHLMAEFNARLDTITLDHYEDYYHRRARARFVEGQDRVQRAFEQQARIDVHTFTPTSLHQFLGALQGRLGFRVVHFKPQGPHIHLALRKAAPPRD